jgi:hypothetical protein
LLRRWRRRVLTSLIALLVALWQLIAPAGFDASSNVTNAANACPGRVADITGIETAAGSVCPVVATPPNGCDPWQITSCCFTDGSLKLAFTLCANSPQPVRLQIKVTGDMGSLSLSPMEVTIAGCQQIVLSLEGTVEEDRSVTLTFSPSTGVGEGPSATVAFRCPSTATPTPLSAPTATATPPPTATAVITPTVAAAATTPPASTLPPVASIASPAPGATRTPALGPSAVTPAAQPALTPRITGVAASARTGDGWSPFLPVGVCCLVLGVAIVAWRRSAGAVD